MKKIIALLMALCMVLALCACGQQAAPAVQEAPTQTETTEPAEAPAEVVEEEPAVEWPTDPVGYIVAFAAGGDNDIACRITADAISKKTGATTSVENITGGSGVVGRTELLTKEPDGTALLLDQLAAGPIAQVYMGNTTYDIDHPGTLICCVGNSATALCVTPNNDKGIQTFEDFVAYAKEHPGELNVATPGQFVFVHLAFIDIFNQLGIDCSFVPANGSAGAITETLGGHVDALAAPLGAIVQYFNSGDLICLGTTGETAFVEDPYIITRDKSIVNMDDWYTWYGIWGPEGMDPALVKSIAKVYEEVLTDDEVVDTLFNAGVQVTYLNVEEANAQLDNYRVKIYDSLVTGGAIEG